MTTRNSAKMSADDAIKNLVTKSDVDSVKSFIEWSEKLNDKH